MNKEKQYISFGFMLCLEIEYGSIDSKLIFFV